MSSVTSYPQNKLPKLSFQVRKQLISLVEEKSFSIKKACRKLNVNYSTGKLIMKKYKSQGKITKFSYERRKPCLSNRTIIEEPQQNLNHNGDQSIAQDVLPNSQIIQHGMIMCFWMPNFDWTMQAGNFWDYQSWNYDAAVNQQNSVGKC